MLYFMNDYSEGNQTNTIVLACFRKPYKVVITTTVMINKWS